MKSKLKTFSDYLLILGILCFVFFFLFNLLAPHVQSGAIQFPAGLEGQALIAESIPINWLVIMGGLLLTIILFKGIKVIVILAILAALAISLLYTLHHYQFTLS